MLTVKQGDLSVQAIEVFSDPTGIYRSFEAQSNDPSSPAADGPSTRSTAIRQGQQSRMQLTTEQIERLQNEKPAITAEEPTIQTTMNASSGSQWLALVMSSGRLQVSVGLKRGNITRREGDSRTQIRALPDLALVLESDGLNASEPSFADDYTAADIDDENSTGERDTVTQMLFANIGTTSPRPHLLALHTSGRLNIYEAIPRFTLDTASQSRRSLAVRFRKVHTQLLPSPLKPKLSYTLVPFANIEGHTGVFITGEKPFWILSSDAHPLKAYPLKQSAHAFGRTTHLGGTGEYFIRIEDVSSPSPRIGRWLAHQLGLIHLLPPSNTYHRLCHAVRPIRDA